MFTRFTHGAREIVVRAQDESSALGHNYVGTEHLLLALADDSGATGTLLRSLGVSADSLRAATRVAVGGGAPIDADALHTIGIDLEQVRSRVEETFGPGALERTRSGKRFCGHRRFTPRAKKALELAWREAARLGDREIRTEHVLLGVLRGDDRSVALELLEQHGVRRYAVREAVERTLVRPA